MARLVIDEEELRNAHTKLRYSLRDPLTETVDEPARAASSYKSLRLTIARVERSCFV
jgi:hypothetical protein